jgi:hypothetical protein
MQSVESKAEEQQLLDQLIADGVHQLVIGPGLPVYDPPCSCHECQDHFYLRKEQLEHLQFCYSRKLSDLEARVSMTGDVEEIKTSHEYIKRVVQLHGDTILKVWRKRSPAKRASLLRLAEPEIADRKGFVMEPTVARLDNKSDWHPHRKRFLIPFIDIETLTKNPATFVGLVNARAHSLPEEWALYDSEQLRSSWGIGAFRIAFHGGAVVMHGSDYGKLVPWDKKAAHRCDIIGYPRGSLIIEAQATLLRFLRRAVEQLLEGLAADSPEFCAKWNEIIQHGLKLNNANANWSKFVHQPFTAAPQFEIEDIVSQAKLRLNATSDHLWLLQTEPAYLRRYLRKLSQARIVSDLKSDEMHICIILSELIGDIEMNWYWRAILAELEQLRRLLSLEEHQPRPGLPLSRPVDRALGALEVYLVNLVLTRGRELHAGLSQRPGFEFLYNFKTEREGVGIIGTARVKKEYLKGAHQSQRLWFLLMKLIEPPDDAKRYRYSMILDLLEDHLATSNRQERGRLDDILFEKLSDYLVLQEMLWTIRFHRPKNTIRELAECRQSERRLAWNTEGPLSAHQQNHKPTQIALKVFMESNVPSGGKNRKWLDDFEHCHKASQALWKSTSTLFENHLKTNKLPLADVRASMDVLHAWKSGEYHAALSAKRVQILADLEKPKSSGPGDVFLSLPTAKMSLQETITVV